LETELVFKLSSGTLKNETLKSHILADNPSGTAWQRVSLLYLIEPILADFLAELSNMGESQTKWETMQLALDLIKSTIHSEAYLSSVRGETLRNYGTTEL
jgi:hypothetical protein